MEFTTSDGCALFAYVFTPKLPYRSTVHAVAGVTGINHEKEGAMIELLANGENRVVIMHPRGTGLSQGKRGDFLSINRLVDDLVEFIQWDRAQDPSRRVYFLYGHSMSTALLLAAAERLEGIAGAILVNPPYLRKRAKGMSPTAWQILNYAFHYLFARHTPVVDMGGDPSRIANEEDRREAEEKRNDPLLVNILSLHSMLEVQRLLGRTLGYCRRANYPMLLIHGLQDPVVERAGCDRIFEQWQHPDKEYRLIADGGHGRSTVLGARDQIQMWLKEHGTVRTQ
ncbi:MAG: alpha/beta fold hydrolase [Flavobacteriales bacterium]|nr:alpha/beta fold hydrolase [Flavobacteriales bacterium]